MLSPSLPDLPGLPYLAGFLAAPLDLPPWGMAALRIVVSLLVLLLLYRVLGYDGEGWGGDARSVARRAGFALLGGITCFLFTSQWVPQKGGPRPQGRGFEQYVEGVATYRAAFARFAGQSIASEARLNPDEAVEKVRKASELLPESAAIHRTLGIMLAERGDYAGALKELRATAKILSDPRRDPARARLERQVWSELFGPKPPTPAEIEAASRQLDRWQLGWFRSLAKLAAYRRLGEDTVPPAVEQEVYRTASVQTANTGAINLFTLLGLPLLGLISAAVIWVLVAQGVLRRAPVRLHAVAPILWETFILMMALTVLPSLLVSGGRRISPELQPGLAAGLLLAQDVAQLPAIAYLWIRLRGRGLNLGEIGLTRRHFGANVLIGVMAAVILIPANLVVGLLIQWVSNKLFPGVPPPYHPLSGMVATSASWEIRTALFIGAAIGAPLLEEIFFRGCLYGAIRRHHGIAYALLASAAFFSFLHPQLPLGFIPIALLGAAFAALYEWRQSLVPAMVAHFVNNGFAFLALNVLFPPPD
ncbi:MAG: type II CAAX prenyl endopeptidase Rce1 family protein [Armatimonadota bacterium]